MASSAALAWRWTPTAFVRAFDAGAFGTERVEMVDGEVLAVSIGEWHGDTAGRLFELLPGPRSSWVKTTQTLVTIDSLPDPDLWIRAANAVAAGAVGARLSRWRPEDVALVVEVSDSSFEFDTGSKADAYARVGFSHYWVVHPGGVEWFSEPAGGTTRSHSLSAPMPACQRPQKVHHASS